MTCCSASARPRTAPRWAGRRAMAGKPRTSTPAAGRRAARHRRAEARIAAGSHPAGPAEPAVLRLSLSLSLSVDLPRLPRRERPHGAPGGGCGGVPVLVWPSSEVDAMIWEAVYAALATSSGRQAIPGLGRITPALTARRRASGTRRISVAHSPQHTSRDGDMQLHIHFQIAHIARPAPTANGGRRTRWVTTSTSARSGRSWPSIWRRR